MLNETAGDSEIWLNSPLQDALRYRATQGIIRQAYLLSHGGDILSSIISALTPDGEGVQQKSIDLRSWGAFIPDVSKFFATPRSTEDAVVGLPRGTNYTLSFNITRSSPTPPPTISELLLILDSNPGLYFHWGVMPTSLVSLRRLRKLYLAGGLYRVFSVSRRSGLRGIYTLFHNRGHFTNPQASSPTCGTTSDATVGFVI